ncbi:conserved hypothetical protein [Candidatus Terasakiella magnetica]|nr:conserved hypothetical protein [Candidatus Terasakiella magnetica]
MPRPPTTSNATIIHRINITLEGPVADVMAQLVPDLKKLPRRGVLEHILDDPELLDRCFKAFHANTDRFRELLVDQHNVPVEDANALLACGRSLEDVVAMVVRTCAKRHFRKRLDGDDRPLKAGRKTAARHQPEPGGLFGKLMRMFQSAEAAPTPTRKRSEALYNAFQEHLIHDWQVPLVPEYSTLSPQMVRRLGKRILDYKVPEDIRRLKDNPSELPTPSTKPDAIPEFLLSPKAKAQKDKDAEKSKTIGLTSSGAARHEVTSADGAATVAAAATTDRRARIAEILTPDQKRVRSAAFTMTLLDPAVRAELPNSEQTVRLTGLLAEVGGLPAKMLVGELGLRMDQLAVMTLIIRDIVGDETFPRTFGVPGSLDYVSKFIERAKAAGIDQTSSLPEVAAFTRKTLAGKPKQAPPSGAALII